MLLENRVSGNLPGHNDPQCVPALPACRLKG